MNHGTTDADWEALGRYLAGESPPEEAARVDRWLAEDPARRDWLARLSGALQHESSAPVDVEAALLKVKSRFSEAEVLPLPSRPAIHRHPVARFAAAIALIVGAAFVVRQLRTAPGTAEPVNYRTLVGQRDSVLLADGSRVLLGPGSELTVGAGYGGSDRPLTLQGQAFFDVRHDSGRPFIIRAAGALITDLGTSFSVRADSGEVEVVVVTDSVALQDTAKSRPALLLRAGTRGVFQTGQTTRLPPRTPDDLAWTTGRLVFDNAPLQRVQQELRRWYGLTVVLADSSLARRHLSAAFAGETREQVLNTIALALGVAVERRRDTVVLRARKPGP